MPTKRAELESKTLRWVGRLDSCLHLAHLGWMAEDHISLVLNSDFQNLRARLDLMVVDRSSLDLRAGVGLCGSFLDWSLDLKVVGSRNCSRRCQENYSNLAVREL
jgi:hypothetical protein